MNRCNSHHFTLTFFRESLKLCGVRMFRCVDNSCIPHLHICNGHQDCPCSEDEMLCNGSNKETFTIFPHSYYHKLLSMFHNDFSFLPSNGTNNLIHCRNVDKEHLIPENKWCVYEHLKTFREPLYCPFAEHLKNCSKVKCNGFFKCPNSYCIPYKYVCDDTWDCPRGHDEQICHNINCSGSFHCQKQTVCISLERVCDGVPDCFLKDDEIFCQFFCPPQCLCISAGVTCSNIGISKIPSFGKIFESSIVFLNVEGNPLQLGVTSFVHLYNLEYLNISNTHIKYLCLRKVSMFLFMKSLLILDVSKNKILNLSNMCVFGLPNLKIFYIQQNPLNSIDPKSFFNLYSLPLLRLNNLYLEKLGNSFFCCISKNNLQILDISKNKLNRVSSKTFKYLYNLKVLLIYGNKFGQLLSEDVIRNLPLIIYHVQDSLECCKVSLILCMFVNEYPIACNIKDLPSNVLFSMQLPLMLIGFLLNVVLSAMILFTGFYQKKPLQFLITVKDVITILSYTSLSVFALIFHSLSEMAKFFCLSIGVLSYITLMFDLLVKVVESIILIKCLDAKFCTKWTKV